MKYFVECPIIFKSIVGMYVVMKIPVNLRFRYTSTVAELFDEPYFMAYSLQIKTMEISVKKIMRLGVTSIEKFKLLQILPYKILS